MQPNEVKALLESRMMDVIFISRVKAANFQVIAVGEVFEGLSAVKRQQLIYTALNDEIASGTLHAISIKT